MDNYKISYLQCLLTVVFLTAFLVSNIVVNKQIVIPIINWQVTGAEFLFPLTYILSDVFSEVYGYRWSRVTCYIAFTCNFFMVTIFTLVLWMPYPDYWLNQQAFEAVLGNTPRIFLASCVAYVVGDFVNDRVFRAMKRKHMDTHEGFGYRAILSSVFGDMTDTAIILPIGFLGIFPVDVLLEMFVATVGVKLFCETIMLPITTKVVNIVGKVEKDIS